MKKIKLTKDFAGELQEIAEKQGMKPEDMLIEALKHIVPPEETIVTESMRETARELAIKYQGKYGLPKLNN